jgi:hypothetical protein
MEKTEYLAPVVSVVRVDLDALMAASTATESDKYAILYDGSSNINWKADNVLGTGGAFGESGTTTGGDVGVYWTD